MLSFRLLLPALILLSFLYSCSKDYLPQAGGERLHRIVSGDGDSTAYFTFNYDTEGKLTVFEDSNSQTHMGRTLIFYNENKKMVKRVWMKYYGSYNNLLTQGADSLVYDTKGRIIQKILLIVPNNSSTYITSNTFSYDEQGRLLVDTTHGYWSNDIAALTKFTYDASGNVVQSEDISYWQGMVYSSTTKKITYTSTDNPYKHFGMAAYFFLYDKDAILSTHAPLQVRYQDNSTKDYSYEYYDNGLPKRVIKKYKEQGVPSQTTMEFFYK